ncbi:IucA/IucC family protein [Aquimarina rhabdastrellae]
MDPHIIQHIQPEAWNYSNRIHLCKAISEFTHELLFDPVVLKKETLWTTYTLEVPNTTIIYQFNARRLFLDHWHIDPSSLIKLDDTTELPLSSIDFIIEFKESLGIPEALLPTYLEEITSTLYSAAYKYQNEKFDVNALTQASFQDIEHAMTDGHPCFVANNGRIGFNAQDYLQYTPEADTTFQLVWIAAHKDRAAYTAIESLPYQTLLQQELGDELIQEFQQKIKDLNLEVSNYIFMPVHPWQWYNKIIRIFAADIATQKMIYLGLGDDHFSPQQSIRTLFNASHPEKLYTKTALSILNMGFMRGLSPYYMRSTPSITSWITDLFQEDSYLNECGFTMLGEIATIGYRNLNYEPLGRSVAHNKMLATLWRESPIHLLKEGQHLMTMAAFLHLDSQGKALLPELIKASGISTDEWVQRYLKCYFSPLIHCFYAYELVFMPHGENLIMLMEHNIPVKAIMKDITEEVIVFNEALELPEHVQRLYTKATDETKTLSILTDVFDCFFRFMGSIFETQSTYTQERFWYQVAQCILDYQKQHPEFETKYEHYDLFATSFKRCCLNRLQLKNNMQMLDLADPIESLQFIGALENPIAQYQPKPHIHHA